MSGTVPPNYGSASPDPVYSAVEIYNDGQDIVRDYVINNQDGDAQQRALDAEHRRQMGQTNQR